MIKTTFLKAILFIISVSVFSCSSDSEPNVQEDKSSIDIDYIVNVGFIADFSINNNNEIIFLRQGNSSGDVNLSLRKISETGKESILDNPDFSLWGNSMGITYSKNNDNIYYVTDVEETGSNIYIYSVDMASTSTYSMKPISSTFSNPIRMNVIESLGDNTYVVFDYSSLSLKRYIPDLNTDVIIAGSNNSSITDGEGLNASFKYVSKMTSHNGVIYLIDDLNNIRKVEEINNKFNVTTLISNYSDEFSDLTIDKNGNLLVLTQSDGIYI